MNTASQAVWPNPDVDQIRRFLELLGKPQGTSRLRSLFPSGDPRKDGDPGRKAAGRPALIEEWQAEGRGVYIVINDNGDKDQEITACRALFCEWDDRPLEWQIQAWQELGLPEPTMQVSTGGKSIHNYWVLREPLPPERWRDLQRRLLEHADADRSLKNPSRVMRLPGCWYMQPNNQPGELVQIVHESGQSYSAAELEACLPELPGPQPTPAPASRGLVQEQGVPLTQLLPRDLEQLAEQGAQEGSRNDNCFRLAAGALAIAEAATAAGLKTDGTPEQVLLAFASRCSPPLPEQEALAVLRSADSESRSPDPGWPERLRWQLNRQAGHRQLSSQQQPVASLLPATSEAARQCKDQPGQTEKLDALLGTEQEGRLRKPPKDLLTQVVEAVVPLRFNQLTNRIENDGQPVDGDFLGTLYLQLAERYAIDVQKERAADAALLVSRRSAFHPVRLYLQDLESRSICLPAEDWAALDARVFGSEVSGGWGIVHLQRQLIAAVARAMQPGCEVHTALVLHSDQQGIGKSSLWKILGGAWFSDSLGDLKDLKEDRLQLHSAWIHEWGEIDAVMGKRDSETLKRFLSCSQDDVRRPYGRGTEQLKRSCVIVGTTNRRDFIKDPTGNRRFPIISIRQVNTRWIKEHRDAIWGSALAAYKAGERWHYDDQEIAQINDAALAFAAEDPLRDQIETWAEDHPGVQEAPLARILPEAGCIPAGEPPDQKLVQRASTVMRSIGWRRADKKRRYLLPNGDKTDNTWGWLRDAA